MPFQPNTVSVMTAPVKTAGTLNATEAAVGISEARSACLRTA